MQVIKNIYLELPNISKDLDLNIQGKWTMVYDEGFEVFIDSLSYFAFSKYINVNNQVKHKILNISHKKIVKNPKDDDDEQIKGYSSQCD